MSVPVLWNLGLNWRKAQTNLSNYEGFILEVNKLRGFKYVNVDLDLKYWYIIRKRNITNMVWIWKKHLLHSMPLKLGVSCKACLGDKYFDILIVSFFYISLVLGQTVREIKGSVQFIFCLTPKNHWSLVQLNY